eukprot:425285_1
MIQLNGDTFLCRGGFRPAEFKMMEIDPPEEEFCIIHCDGEPAKPEDEETMDECKTNTAPSPSWHEGEPSPLGSGSPLVFGRPLSPSGVFFGISGWKNNPPAASCDPSSNDLTSSVTSGIVPRLILPPSPLHGTFVRRVRAPFLRIR